MVLWLWEDTHVLNIVGSNPSTIYWVDSFLHLIVVKIAMFVWKDKSIQKLEITLIWKHFNSFLPWQSKYYVAQDKWVSYLLCTRQCVLKIYYQSVNQVGNCVNYLDVVLTAVSWTAPKIESSNRAKIWSINVHCKGETNVTCNGYWNFRLNATFHEVLPSRTI